VVVMVADLADLAGSADPAAGGGADLTVTLTEELSAPWRAVLEQREGVLPDHAVALLRRGTPSFALARGGGLPIGVARGSLSAGWLGLTAVEVAPAARRRGAATALLAGLVDHAVARGATHAWLQVAVDNTVARRVYAGLGFAEHHRYYYRWAP
jgi:N-acetylglutamate synthase